MKLRSDVVGGTLALAALYTLTARLGLALDAVAGFATLVWAPTGLSIAALLLFGYRLWPGVFIGAFIANVGVGAPAGVAAGIAAGNTLEAIVAYALLRKLPDFHRSLDRVRDAVAFLLLAAVVSTAVSASIGVASLYLGGQVVSSTVRETFEAWWIGDLIGDTLVAPLILVWWTSSRLSFTSERAVEVAALVALGSAGAWIVFAPGGPAASTFAQAYLCFPTLIWAALRFGPRGAVSMSFALSAIAVWATATGHGPFVRADLHESLLSLQTFMGVAAATFLLLGAASSERRQAEAELSDTLARLSGAYETVSSANQAKADFLAVVSHELRTPLNAIAGYIQLVQRGVMGPITDRQRDALNRVEANQVHLLTLIDDVLSFAKIEAGRIELAISDFPVRRTLGEIPPLVEPTRAERGLSLEFAAVDSALAVRADPEKLRQIVLNLVGNSMKFTPRGGRVTVGADRIGGDVRIWVRDNGIGIPAEKLSRVFEPFFQVEQGMTRRYPGVGLGLSISRDIARRMNGDVTIESRPGEGTTATIRLPAATDVARPADNLREIPAAAET